MANLTPLPADTIKFVNENPEYAIKALQQEYIRDLAVGKQVTAHSMYNTLCPYLNPEVTLKTFTAKLSELMSMLYMRSLVSVDMKSGESASQYLYKRLPYKGTLPTLNDLRLGMQELAEHGHFKNEENKAMRECEANRALAVATSSVVTDTHRRVKAAYVKAVKSYSKDGKEMLSHTFKAMLLLSLMKKGDRLTYAEAIALTAIPSFASRLIDFCKTIPLGVIARHTHDFEILEDCEWGGPVAMSRMIHRHKRAVKKEKLSAPKKVEDGGFFGASL